MALFGQGGQGNQNKMQQQMFDKEIQSNRESDALQQAGIGDDVYFAQKEKNEDLTRWQQDLKEEIEKTVHDFRREVEDEDGNYKPMLMFKEYRMVNGKRKIIYKKAKPMMNSLGINMFRGAVRPLISRNLMMSSYSEDKIYVKLRSIMFTFISHLAYHQKVYEIDVGNLSMIVRMFKDICEPAHWRALNNGERSYLNTINKRVEAITYGANQQQGQNRKGLLQGLMG